MTEIVPNVHWLKAGLANVYLCVDENGLVLFDTGIPGQADNILGVVARLGHEPSDLKHIFITHADWDHAGSVAALQARTDATVYASAETASWLQRGQSPKHLPSPLHSILRLVMRYKALSAAVINVVEGGQTLPILGGLEVLAAPGHSPDHYAFYSPANGALFAGDALRTKRERLGLGPRFITSDAVAARGSAERLLALAPALIACGHGAPLQDHSLDDVMQLLDRLKTASVP